MELEELIKKVAEYSGLPEQDVKAKMKEKEEELSGLISKEGVVYIVAKELGINLLEKMKKRLKIKNIVANMKNVDIVGKIISISAVRNFKTEKAEGKVASIYIADETSSIRIVLWNDETKFLDKFNVGDVIRVQGYVKDNNGQLEIRLGKYGKIMKSDEKITTNIKPERVYIYERNYIKNLDIGMRSEIRAAIVQIFRTKGVLKLCPQCNKQLEKKNNEFICSEHGKQEPKYLFVVSGVVDDGTGNIRFTAFDINAEKITGLKTKDALDVDEWIKKCKQGKEFILRGIVKKNEFFDRPEFIINEIKDVDVEKEIELILDKI